MPNQIDQETINNNIISDKKTFLEKSAIEGVIYQVSHLFYNKDGVLESQTDNLFEIGTDDERLEKAKRYLKITCQNILYSTIAKDTEGGILNTKFEIHLLKKDKDGVDILYRVNKNNLENVFYFLN